MSFPPSNTAKTAELQIMIWFLEAGWEVFTPLVDVNGTDMVVRDPVSKALVAVQVKHKQPGAKNEGNLKNDWQNSIPPFDFLVFYQPSKIRGVIVPAGKLMKEGSWFIFFKKDTEGYSTGPVRPLFSTYEFNLARTPDEDRAAAFACRFSEVLSQSEKQ